MSRDRAWIRWRRPAGMALAAILVAIGAVILLRHREALARDLELRTGWLAAVLVGELSLVAARAQVTRFLCRPFDVWLGPFEAVALAAWTSLANYVAPMIGGVGVRAAYLKRRHGLSLASLASIYAATYAVHFSLLALAGLGLCWGLPALEPAVRASLTLLFGGLLVVGVVALGWPFGVPASGGIVWRSLRRVVEGWRRIRASRLPSLVLLLLVYLVLGWGTFFAYFRALSIPIGVAEALLVSVLAELSIVLAITPAGLGITESAVVFGAGLAAVPIPHAVAMAALRRGVTVVIAASVSSCFFPARGRNRSSARRGTAGSSGIT